MQKRNCWSCRYKSHNLFTESGKVHTLYSNYVCTNKKSIWNGIIMFYLNIFKRCCGYWQAKDTEKYPRMKEKIGIN